MTRRAMEEAFTTAKGKLRANGLLLIHEGEDYCVSHAQPLTECRKSCPTVQRLIVVAREAA